MRKRIVELIMACVLLVCFLLLSKEAVEVLRAKEKEEVIVIDAGHGGRDPGVVGINEVQEKDINLLIAMKLKSRLEEAGYKVILTREDDFGLYEEGTQNMKMQDLNNRIALIKKSEPILTISIHQNSFPDESVCGPQVFYHERSAEGRKLAASIQENMNKSLDVLKEREIKSNVSYYLLKEVESTIAIVECGFLTNPSEVVLLQNEEYQERIAEAITEGINQYLGKEMQNSEDDKKEKDKEEESKKKSA